MTLAKVKEGVLYIPKVLGLAAKSYTKISIPTATAIPPGINRLHDLPIEMLLARVVTANASPIHVAHSRAMGGRPFPVTSLAVYIHT